MTAPEQPQAMTPEEARARVVRRMKEAVQVLHACGPGDVLWSEESRYSLAELLRVAAKYLELERDDTAELVEALAEPLRYFLEWREEIESDLGIWASKSQTREAFDQAEAALARVKEQR